MFGKKLGLIVWSLSVKCSVGQYKNFKMNQSLLRASVKSKNNMSSLVRIHY